MKRNKRITGGPLVMLASGAMLIVVCLLQPAAVRAQWTTPDGNQNINNTNTGNVGVGTTSPNYKFDITNALNKAQVRFGLGAGDSGGFLFSGGPSHAVFSAGASYNDGWFARSLSASMIEANLGQLTFYTNPGISTGSPFTPTARMVIASSGNVGIGTTSPGARLVTFGNFLAGNLTNHTQLYSSYNTQAPVILELGYGTATADVAPYPSLVLSKNLTSSSNLLGVISFANSNIADGNEKRLGYIAAWTDEATNNGLMTFATATAGTITERMRIGSNGNVGIGTTTPGHRFEVVGPGTWLARFRRTDNSNGGILIDSPAGYSPNLGLATNGTVKWYLNSNASDSDKMQFWETTGSHIRFTLTQAGNLGLGTTAPSYKLHVQGGSINASDGLCINGDCKTSWSQVGGSQWANGTGSINYSSGNVGIGLTSPQRLLHLHAASSAVFQLTDGTSGSASTDGFQIVQSGLTSYLENKEAGSLILRTAATDRMLINSSGNVGIATASPTEKLHVTGNVKIEGSIDVTGNIKAKYQDVAEWVESSQELHAATVVVLDSSKSNQVVASTQSYDSRVAGVISLRPGLALGEEGAGRVLVATTGRVKVKVDATNGPIEIGDLLVTSDREGFAMKSVPVEIGGVRIHRPGTLIGKALEPLSKGTGEILVLLSMQ